MALTKVKNVIDITADTMADLLSMQHKTGSVQLLGFHERGDGGGGVFYWDDSKSQSEHNGGTIIAGDAVLGTWDTAGQEVWFTAPSAGVGCWVREYSGAVNVKWFGMGKLNEDCFTVAQQIFRNFGVYKKDIYIPNGTYQFSIFNPNNCNIVAENAVFEFTKTPTTSVVMGQVANCYIRGLTFKSLETDLENQRVAAENSTFEECKFVDWRNPTNSNAWGLYLKDCANIKVVRCGFDNNTQSDIAVVDNVKNVTIENCYAINSIFILNCEPNSSASINENINVSSCEFSSVYLLENGSGGTANKNVTFTGCVIGDLKYDGASASFNNCRIDSFSQETDIFFGLAKFDNTLNLSPNLLTDPFFFTFSFNDGQSLTENNYWRINSKNTVGGDYIEFGEDNGLRYTRVNPQNESKTVNFIQSSADTINTTAGDTYLIAVTGRNVSGSSGRYFQTYDGVSNKNCYIFRQSNDNVSNFITEVAFVTCGADGTLPIKVGKWDSSQGIFDVSSVSVHKVLGSGVGGNEREVLSAIHSNYMDRVLVTTGVPTPSGVSVLHGYQKGDKVIPTTGNVSVWNGTSFVSIY
jgi:hypothetical protein